MNLRGGSHQRGRDLYVAIVLCIVVGLPIFVFFNIITGGLFVLLLILIGGVAVLGGIHYLLWGRSFTAETAGEREEEQLRAELEGDLRDGDFGDEPWGHRRF
jgi:hypothetical protein